MRLSVLYNKAAGNGVSLDSICRLLAAHGHTLVQVLEKSQITMQPLAGEALVAAGGDGTVAAAVRLVASGERPLGILPLGTANNIARSLDIDGSLDTIVDGWRIGEPRSVDLGFVGGPWGVGRFIESVGGGLVADGIVHALARPDSGTAVPRVSLLDGARGYLELLPALKPIRSTIVADGETIEGDFLLVEVLNMPLVGSNLHLAADAAPTDGLLSIVAVTEDEREALEAYLHDRVADRVPVPPFPSRTAAHVDLVGWQDLHVDDRHHRAERAGRVSIEVDPGALRVL